MCRRRVAAAGGGEGNSPIITPLTAPALPSAVSQPLHDRILLCCCFRVVITIIIISVALPLPLLLPCIHLLLYTDVRTDAHFYILHFNYKLQRRAEQSRAVDRHQ